MIGKVDAIMQNNLNPNWKVFIGTVPLVTIAPIAKGVGETTEVPIDKVVDGKEVSVAEIYYKYYTYFPFAEKFAVETGRYLTMQAPCISTTASVNLTRRLTNRFSSSTMRTGLNGIFWLIPAKCSKTLPINETMGSRRTNFPAS